MSNRFEFTVTVQMTERELDALRRIVQDSQSIQGILVPSNDPVKGDQSIALEVMLRIVENAHPIPQYSCS